MLTVAIAVEPPSQPVAAEQAVAKSCQAALGSGRCQAEDELAPTAVVAWFAVVRVDEAEPNRLTIEFHDRSRNGALIESRSLSFADADAPEARLASAGAVIAAFVAARDQGGGPEPALPPPAAPPPAERAPEPEPPAPRGPLWNVDLAVYAGPALETGPYRLGGLGRLIVSLPEAPGVLGLVSGRYAERPGDLNLSFWSAACGFGARVGAPGTWASAELTGELVFERMIIVARDHDDGREEQLEQNRFGGRLSVTSAWSLATNLALLVGADASVMRPTVSVYVGGDYVGRAPAVSFALSSGLRLSF